MTEKFLLLNKIRQFIEENIDIFHSTRLITLRRLELRQILIRQNPYIFKTKYLISALDLVKFLLDNYLLSQEETRFGKLLEDLAIYICGQIYDGKKSSHPGVDLEFQKEDVFYLVSIEPGPDWGNIDQIRKMQANFRQASEEIRQINPGVEVIAVNGCCYGQEAYPNKGDYFKYCGQDFWEFISGIKGLYTQIIEPLGYNAKENSEEFLEEYAKTITRFTVEFVNEFCINGQIDWKRLV